MKLKMDTSIFWITSLLIMTLTVKEYNCDTLYGLSNKPPHRLVELVGLMLPQRPDDTDKKGFGIQRVPQEGGPNYEILITPNENSQESKDSQKIKIFVEASNFDADERGKAEVKKKSNGESGQKIKDVSIYDVLPLSIGTVGLNIDRYQQSGDTVVKISKGHYNQDSLGVVDDLTQKDYESYPSKRQTNWGKTNGGRSITRQPEIKEVVIQREPSYVDQNNPHQPAVVSKKDQRVPTYDGDYSSSSQNGKRITQQTYVGEYANPAEQTGRPQALEVPKRNYENYENTYEGVRPSNEKKPIIREPEVGRPSSDRGPTVIEPEKPRPVYGRQPYNRETEEEYRPSPGRGTAYKEPDERRPVYEARPSNEREPTYEEYRPPGKRVVYVEETRPQSSNNRKQVHEETFSNDGKRYQDSNAHQEDTLEYGGFLESYTPDFIHSNSTPLQYEPVRAFPASPCLNIFKYEGREPDFDRWYGDIYVSTDEVLNGMRLDITLDRPAELLANWLAEVKTKDSVHFTILSLTHKLVPGPAETVRIMVKFNEKKPVPYLKSINLNGRLICPVNRGSKTTTTTRRPIYENPELQFLATTEIYQEGPKKPFNNFGNEFESNTKRTTGHVERRTTPPYEETRPATAKPPPRPNPNGYEETDQNSFNSPTKKPPGRPSHSNGKPPSHASKPGQGGSSSSSSVSGNSQNNNNKKPSKPPTGSNRPVHGSGNFNQQGSTGPTAPNKPITNVPVSNKVFTCGTQSVQPQPLITHGAATLKGQWPWHVALFKNSHSDLSFSCSGSLLNNKYVLTAAHCATETHTMNPLDEKSLYICAGTNYRKLCAENDNNFIRVSKIHVHPNYNSTSYNSDIAVLALSRPIEFSEFVKPVCLWDRTNTAIEEVVGKVGTVVGWGFDENIQLTDDLRQAKMPVVSHINCVSSYSEFYAHFASDTSYCAGYRNGTSVCNGDSGGGMVFPYKDNNGIERWFIRGIVSITPSQSGKLCDLSHYVLFTDVAKYLPWLDKFV